MVHGLSVPKPVDPVSRVELALVPTLLLSTEGRTALGTLWRQGLVLYGSA